MGLMVIFTVKGNHIGPHKGFRGAVSGGRVHDDIVALNIKEFGGSSLLRFANGHILPGQDSGDFTLGVVHVPGNNGMFRADNDTGRFEADVGPVGTEVTLGRCICFGVDVDSIVGAGLHAGFAADTDAVVEFDDAVRPLIHGFGGAYSNTRGVGTMVAARDLEVTAIIGEGSRFNILYPGSIHPERNFVFALTCCGAGMTADTFPIVYDKPVILFIHMQFEPLLS